MKEIEEGITKVEAGLKRPATVVATEALPILVHLATNRYVFLCLPPKQLLTSTTALIRFEAAWQKKGQEGGIGGEVDAKRREEVRRLIVVLVERVSHAAGVIAEEVALGAELAATIVECICRPDLNTLDMRIQYLRK